MQIMYRIDNRGEIIIVYPTMLGDNSISSVLVWDKTCGHGSACWDWVLQETSPLHMRDLSSKQQQGLAQMTSVVVGGNFTVVSRRSHKMLKTAISEVYPNWYLTK